MAEKQTYRFTNEIDGVEISSLGAKVVVRPHDGSEVLAEYANPKGSPEFCAVLNGTTLTLKETPILSLFGNKPSEDYVISVLLPATCFKKLKVCTASGGVDLADVSAETFELNTASGEIKVSAFFENAKIQSASGSVELQNPTDNIAKSVSVCTVSGNASIAGYKAESFSLHSVSGKTAYSEACGKGEISVTSGTVDVTYADWNDDLSISAISGCVNITVPENAGADINFSGVSGMLKTDLGNDKGSFMNLGKGTEGAFGGDNKHKLKISLTSGVVTLAQG